MNDYAAAPVQPIVQGLITIVVINAVPTPVFQGKGVSSIQRTPVTPSTPVVSPAGDFVLILDQGLPGNAGEVQPTNPNTVPPTPPQPDARTQVQLRGSLTAAVPGGTSIDEIGVSYVFPSPAPGDGGFTAIRLVFAAAGAPTDPSLVAANGAEVIVWKGIQ